MLWPTLLRQLSLDVCPFCIVHNQSFTVTNHFWTGIMGCLSNPVQTIIMGCLSTFFVHMYILYVFLILLLIKFGYHKNMFTLQKCTFNLPFYTCLRITVHSSGDVCSIHSICTNVLIHVILICVL